MKQVLVSNGKAYVTDERWVTIGGEDNDGSGQHVLIKENGTITAGFGKGKNVKNAFGGKKVSKATGEIIKAKHHDLDKEGRQAAKKADNKYGAQYAASNWYAAAYNSATDKTGLMRVSKRKLDNLARKRDEAERKVYNEIKPLLKRREAINKALITAREKIRPSKFDKDIKIAKSGSGAREEMMKKRYDEMQKLNFKMHDTRNAYQKQVLQNKLDKLVDEYHKLEKV